MDNLTGRTAAPPHHLNGTNHSDLARKYGVSLQWIYKIVKTVRQEEMAKRQSDMFS